MTDTDAKYSEDDLTRFLQLANKVSKPEKFGEVNKLEKANRVTEFCMAIFLSTLVPLIPIGISAITNSLTTTVWMQSICIYLLLVGASAHIRGFQYLAIIGGITSCVFYGMLEGTVAWVVQNEDAILKTALGWCGGMSVSNIILAWKNHITEGRPALGGGN